MADNKLVRRGPSEERVDEMERIVSEYGLSKVAGLGPIRIALTMAEGISLLEQALTTEVMGPINALQGTKLGFLTDKDRDGGYSEKVVKQCVIEGLLRGVRPVMNEMNIIAGGFYATREAFVRLLREFPGLTDLRIDLGVPRGAGEGAVVSCKATWKLSGGPDSMAADIPIKINKGMGTDAILGKADRKMRARIYNRLTGSEFLPEGEVADVVDEKVVGSGSTNGKGSVGMPKAKELAPDPVVDLVSPEDLAHLRSVAGAAKPPMAVDEASMKLYGKLPAELNQTEFTVLLGLVKNGLEAGE